MEVAEVWAAPRLAGPVRVGACPTPLHVRVPAGSSVPLAACAPCVWRGAWVGLAARLSRSRRRPPGRLGRLGRRARQREEQMLPWVAAGVVGLLALGPTLLLGSMAAWWTFISLPMVAANVFVASSLIATLVASLVTAGCAGLLVWLALGNPMPKLTFAAESEIEGTKTEAEVEDPFRDWDQRFAKLRLADLSPDSKFAELRAFAAQEGLEVKTGGRSKAAVLEEIKALLRARR
ncbi:unnamed protein product [Effrenium voratum]|uniref:Uncharacterized protein n=1 Tax=Effrenium voratum TaxID=2562239 RepID=A0AA36JCK6_9DINO|nr:unnamed protein product [Effrenium voratum]